ncbi:hypothetical protein [Burkholderia stagnalis]|uniref:hypothetical protein n=1 Tax=Burkholderia stagnalis TaxID=1503054 RepID=UPI000756E379|nr:hypothetical protein [Burkholderia stagnalis]KVL85386.1 hypothetical protein WT03_29845 [Burkholderia stagnalis]KVL88073.1 hypothetical protein WT02_27255 [Burkholderia stagnalis]KVM06485.1 hypothetical protein WT04_23070 [Burkholderia stagnalis]
MDAKDDLFSELEAIANDGQWDRVLSAFRMRLGMFLRAEFDKEKSMVYLMAYDCGVTGGLYGPDSAICVGMKKGVDDAVHVSSAGLSSTLLDKAEELGRKHGTSMRSMMEGETLLPDSTTDGSSSDSELADRDQCIQEWSACAQNRGFFNEDV